MKILKFIFLSFCIPTIIMAQSEENKVINNSTIDYNKVQVALGMTGRRIISTPEIHDTTQKILRVVVAIQVDRLGNVVRAKATLKGSTTSDSSFFQLAEDAALKTKVNADPSSAEEQFGTITYSFRVK